jgi:dTDP-glucose 4,6-dehydratase
LPVFLIGNGKNKYQIIDVEDCTDAIIKGAESDLSGEIFNVGSDHIPSIREILIEIARREKLKLSIVPLYRNMSMKMRHLSQKIRL